MIPLIKEVAQIMMPVQGVGIGSGIASGTGSQIIVSVAAAIGFLAIYIAKLREEKEV